MNMRIRCQPELGGVVLSFCIHVLGFLHTERQPRIWDPCRGAADFLKRVSWNWFVDSWLTCYLLDIILKQPGILEVA